MSCKACLVEYDIYTWHFWFFNVDISSLSSAEGAVAPVPQPGAAAPVRPPSPLHHKKLKGLIQYASCSAQEYMLKA